MDLYCFAFTLILQAMLLPVKSYGIMQDLSLWHKTEDNDIILYCTFPQHLYNTSQFRSSWKNSDKNYIVAYAKTGNVPVADEYVTSHDAKRSEEGITLRIKDFESLTTNLIYTCRTENAEGLISEATVNIKGIKNKVDQKMPSSTARPTVTSNISDIEEEHCRLYKILTITLGVVVLILLIGSICLIVCFIRSGKYCCCKWTTSNHRSSNGGNFATQQSASNRSGNKFVVEENHVKPSEIKNKEKKKKAQRSNAANSEKAASQEKFEMTKTIAEPSTSSEAKLQENEASDTNMQNNTTETDSIVQMSSSARVHPYDDVELYGPDYNQPGNMTVQEGEKLVFNEKELSIVDEDGENIHNKTMSPSKVPLLG